MKSSIFFIASLILVVTINASSVFAISPNYNQGTFYDVITGDNEFIDGEEKHRWFIDDATDPDGLGDNYNVDIYERPTADKFDPSITVTSTVDATRSADVDKGKTYSATDLYYGYVDIEQAKWGYDDTYMYFQIQLFSAAHINDSGTQDFGQFGAGTLYGVRFGEDGNAHDSILLRADGQENFGASYESSKTLGYWDMDGDVGGPGGILVTNENPGSLTGYEDDIIQSDGMLKATGDDVLFSRINCNAVDDCPDKPIVELAFNYSLYNTESADTIDPTNINYLQFEANRGYKDNSNYLWNDKNSFAEAGSPYNGIDYGNIDELDTLRAFGVVPEPVSSILFATGGAVLVGRRYLRRKK